MCTWPEAAFADSRTLRLQADLTGHSWSCSTLARCSSGLPHLTAACIAVVDDPLDSVNTEVSGSKAVIPLECM